MARIEAACAAAGRDPEAVTLLAASKRRTAEDIEQAMAAGVRVFGENYVPELLEKAGLVRQASWHFIGHLQRNKARRLLPAVAMIHTVDSVRLVDALARHASERTGAPLQVLLQVNVGREPTKSGVLPEALAELAEHLVATPSLQFSGLMTIPPAGRDPARWFSALAALREDLIPRLGIPLPHLSMGMSADLEPAIANGATIVRLGTAIFGPR